MKNFFHLTGMGWLVMSRPLLPVKVIDVFPFESFVSFYYNQFNCSIDS